MFNYPDEEYRPREARLMLNGDMWKSGPRTKDAFNEHTSSSTQVIVQCEEGDRVYLEAVMSEDRPMAFDRIATYFTGFQLANI